MLVEISVTVSEVEFSSSATLAGSEAGLVNTESISDELVSRSLSELNAELMGELMEEVDTGSSRTPVVSGRLEVLEENSRDVVRV